jgi:sensor histidine kinase YesM
LTARRDGDRLVLSVRDRGPGLGDVDGALEGGGIGLSNTSDRLHLLYGDAQSIEFGSSPGGGLDVRIRIPYSEAPEAVTVS